MYSVRLWSVRNAASLEKIYKVVERVLIKMTPVWEKVGYERAEKPVALLEKTVKGFLFDCQMCGQCALSSTGMSCPMNCPKSIRNGPCGGVRANGNCEVKPDMKCVWVAGFEGSRLMSNPADIKVVQFPVDYTLKGSSSWLRVVRQHAEEQASHRDTAAVSQSNGSKTV